MCRWHELENVDAGPPRDEVAAQLSSALADHGLLVDQAVGQSHFRCDLAVRRPGDAAYRLGVLVDTRDYYEQSDVLERDVMRPRLLRDFGWNVCRVFAKDWYQDRQPVVERVLRLVDGETDAALDADSMPIDGESQPSALDDQEVTLRVPQVSATNRSPDGPPNAAEADRNSAAPMEQVGTSRYFEFTDSKSNKFWEITLKGNCHSVHYGRIGAAGQEVSRSFAEEGQAQADAERLIRQKRAKGYQEKAK